MKIYINRDCLGLDPILVAVKESGDYTTCVMCYGSGKVNCQTCDLCNGKGYLNNEM